jgi:hypothetical protein
MSTISDARVTYGLTATGTPTSPTATGSVIIGLPTTQSRITAANVFYAVQALIVGSASDLVIDLADGDKTGSTAWTAGSPQVESATVVAAAGATANGNLAVVVTSSGMTGTPLTVNVALTTAAHTTAALIAQAIVDTLNANATVSARFTATRETATVKLTRKPSGTYTVGAASVPVYIVGNADDFTIPTALGVTGATSTTGAGADAGVASAGCYVVGDGVDFEGVALEIIASTGGFVVANSTASLSEALVSTVSTMVDFPIDSGNSLQFSSPGVSGPVEILTITTTNTALMTVIVTGEV